MIWTNMIWTKLNPVGGQPWDDTLGMTGMDNSLADASRSPALIRDSQTSESPPDCHS